MPTTIPGAASAAVAEQAFMVLARAAGALTSGDRWAQLLDVAARHPGRSVGEILAISHHRPAATELATYDQWKAAGRAVKRGERGFAVLSPDPDAPQGLRYQVVFDIAQTDGRRGRGVRPPVEPGRAALVLGVFAMQDGLQFTTTPGLISRVDMREDRLRSAPDAPAHEVTAAALSYLAARTVAGSPAAIRELEAASVAHVVARRFGLPVPDVAFPAPPRWATAQDPAQPHAALAACLGRILAAADAITDRLVHSQQAPANAATPATPATAQATASPQASATTAAQPKQPAQANQAAPVQEPEKATTVTAGIDIADTKLRRANKVAAEFYFDLLLGQPAAIAYLQSRGIRHASGDPHWRLGYAPVAGTSLLEHLRGKGFTDSELVQAGLVVRRDNGMLRDRFVNRVLFPITDLNESVIGFIGRDLSGRDGVPKWLNTGETPIYRKSEALHGLWPGLAHHLRTLPTDAKLKVVVVEGPADVLAATTAYSGLLPEGTFTIAAAPCGTAFTRHQFDVLSGLVQGREAELVLAFDNDAAGGKAIGRAYDMALTWPHGAVTGLAALDAAKDPAELLAAHGPEEALLTLLAAERPLPLLAIDHAIDRLANAQVDLSTPEGQVRAFTAVSEYVVDANRVGQDMLAVEHLAQRLGVAITDAALGIVTAYEQRHQLGEFDTGPPGRRGTSSSAVAAASFSPTGQPLAAPPSAAAEPMPAARAAVQHR